MLIVYVLSGGVDCAACVLATVNVEPFVMIGGVNVAREW